MRRNLLAVLLALGAASRPAMAQGPDGGGAESGRYITYSLQHAIGSETYSLTPSGPGGSVLTVTASLSDRGSSRAGTTVLTMGARLAPTRLEMKRDGAPADEIWRTDVGATSTTVREPSGDRTLATPAVAYVGFAQMPASLQMMMMRYWLAHGEPAALQILRASDKAPPLEIGRVARSAWSATRWPT